MQRWTMAALVLAFGVARAEDVAKPAANDPQAMMAAVAKHATPGAGHRKLDPLVGKFSYTGKAWIQPGAPPMEFAGKGERKWILDGRFIQESFENEPAGSFTGNGTIGYDNASGEYTSYWIDTMSSSAHFAKGGKFDAAGKTLTFHTEHFCPMEQCQIKGREVVTITGPDSQTVTSYKIGKDGKETIAMELKIARIK